jgi:hypothetical protein
MNGASAAFLITIYAAFLCVFAVIYSPKNYHFFYCLSLGELRTLGNNAIPVSIACFLVA